MPARINLGYCSICQRPVLFERKGPWLRDQYLCCRCGSIPRQRHLMHVLQRVCTDWRTLTIHECAPGGAISEKLTRECPGGSFSHYLPHLTLGSYREDGIRSENLEAMTFLDSSFDVVITQDVFEHVFDVQAAFREIARVLKPGGLHVFTVPLYHGQITMTRVFGMNLTR